MKFSFVVHKGPLDYIKFPRCLYATLFVSVKDMLGLYTSSFIFYKHMLDLCRSNYVSQKKLGHFYFYCNFGKCWSILKILLLLESEGSSS